MRTQPLAPSVELLWGHDPPEGCVDISAGTLRERTHWGLRWSSLWGTILVRGVPK